MASRNNISFTAVPLQEFRGERNCAKCKALAKFEVYKLTRIRHEERIDRSSLRFACADHANSQLWPKRFRAPLAPLKPRQRPIYAGDLSEFYRTIVRELGGEVPMPDKVAPAKRRKKVWAPLEPLPAPKPVRDGYGEAPRGYVVLLEPKARHFKQSSPRQWRKLKKAARRTAKLAAGQAAA